MRYVGIDLHTTQLTVCYREEAGSEKLEAFRIDMVDKFISSLNADDKVAFEATGNSMFLYKKLAEVVSLDNVIVVNTSRFKLISKSVKKTDKNDAKLLAEYLSKDMLPKARLKNEIDSQIHALIETIDNLVRMKTAFKNQVHNIFVKLGIKLKAKDVSSAKHLNKLLEAEELNEIGKFQLQLLIDNILHNGNEADKIEIKLMELQDYMEQIDNLTSICGIGLKSAMGIK